MKMKSLVWLLGLVVCLPSFAATDDLLEGARKQNPQIWTTDVRNENVLAELRCLYENDLYMVEENIEKRDRYAKGWVEALWSKYHKGELSKEQNEFMSQAEKLRGRLISFAGTDAVSNFEHGIKAMRTRPALGDLDILIAGAKTIRNGSMWTKDISGDAELGRHCVSYLYKLRSAASHNALSFESTEKEWVPVLRQKLSANTGTLAGRTLASDAARERDLLVDFAGEKAVQDYELTIACPADIAIRQNRE